MGSFSSLGLEYLLAFVGLCCFYVYELPCWALYVYYMVFVSLIIYDGEKKREWL